ncbi:MAG: hypothetical protein QM581_09120 [Pseudomonas sp.]
MIGGIVLLSYALAFVMPSNMGRIALLMPIVLALADRAGLVDGSRGRTALALAVGFGTFQLSVSILPANVPNLVMAGAAESAYGIHLPYLSYLLLHAPILGLLKGLALVGCLCVVFGAVRVGHGRHCRRGSSSLQAGVSVGGTSVPTFGRYSRSGLKSLPQSLVNANSAKNNPGTWMCRALLRDSQKRTRAHGCALLL